MFDLGKTDGNCPGVTEVEEEEVVVETEDVVVAEAEVVVDLPVEGRLDMVR